MAVLVETERLAELANPLASWRWNGRRLGEQAFRRAVAGARPVPEHVGATASRATHAGRVAYLMRAGWHDPIELEFPVPGFGYPRFTWLITDGNHRMVAALLRQDRYVLVSVFGHLKSAADLLGVCERTLMDEPTCSDTGGASSPPCASATSTEDARGER